MIRYLTLEQLISIHDACIVAFGGLSGIRDANLLASALEAPRTSLFGEEMHPSVYDKAAAYLYHIVQNHPFNDGNKRTGLSASLLFLNTNGIKIQFNDKDLEAIVIQVAQGQLTKSKIAYFFEHQCLN